MEKDLKRVLFSSEKIQECVKEMGEKISKDYEGKELVLVGLLNGAYMFLSDLAKHITIPVQIDFMGVSSYEGTESTGTVKITRDMKIDPSGKHVIFVEDLIDTGTTLHWLMGHLKLNNSASVKLCVLLDKVTDKRCKEVEIDYVGLKCEDVFVVGYGMDYNEYYRNLPYIGELKEEIYN